MIHEPVDLKFDTWFPTDWLSANLRHTVTAIFSHPSTSITPSSSVARGERPSQRSGERRRSHAAAMQSETALISLPQSMEIDQLLDGKCRELLTYFVRGSITVRLTSCLTGSDLAKRVNVLWIKHKQSSWILTSQTGGQLYNEVSVLCFNFKCYSGLKCQRHR